MKVLDLFSGIGGFSLGLEKAGMETIAFCEFEPHAQEVLRKHWPDVPIHSDVRSLGAKQYRGTVDVVCGGFPCQDLSSAGKQAGFSGARSSLYRECLELLASVCLDTQFLRTCQGCLLETVVGGSDNFSMTWPRSGLMQSGTVSRLDTLAHRIDGTGCGLLPTPNASDNRDRGDYSNPSIQRRVRIGKQVGLSMLFKGSPCPMCVEGMMGFRKGWTDLQG